MAGDFAYFNYIIMFTFVYYVLVLLTFLVIRRRKIHTTHMNRIVRGIHIPTEFDDSSYKFELTTTFEEVTQCFFGKGFKFLLGIYRLAGFFYFFIVACIIQGVNTPNSFYAFDAWNGVLITCYFLLASISSFISVYTKLSRTEVDHRLNALSDWSFNTRLLGTITHLFFEIAGASVLFTTVGGFFYIEPVYNLSAINRLLGLFAMVFELILNTLRVRFDQYPATFAWLVFYLLIIWPMAFNGNINQWPYSFMRTDTVLAFANYLCVYLSNLAFYILWYLLYKIKKLSTFYYRRRLHLHREAEETHQNLQDIFRDDDDTRSYISGETSVYSGSSQSSRTSASDRSASTSSTATRSVGPAPPRPYIPAEQNIINHTLAYGGRAPGSQTQAQNRRAVFRAGSDNSLRPTPGPTNVPFSNVSHITPNTSTSASLYGYPPPQYNYPPPPATYYPPNAYGQSFYAPPMYGNPSYGPQYGQAHGQSFGQYQLGPPGRSAYAPSRYINPQAHGNNQYSMYGNPTVGSSDYFSPQNFDDVEGNNSSIYRPSMHRPNLPHGSSATEADLNSFVYGGGVFDEE